MEKGYIFPITLMLSVLLSGFLLHQIELYRMEKLFYAESDELFELEHMMKYSWDSVENELQTDTFPLLNSISFPSGTATISTQDTYPIAQIKIICVTTNDRRYEATIQYDRAAYQVISWIETN
ncbi:competence type IV pilus minor pilin ComGG [Sutcliffiella halmapala]|uniref:competence type IV pilus minor pilin ComGG n=1 Tax=Sutcliffiella halmapala TaxID=79882 RepID=UPI00099579DE|nr:competence type IV pilus minor pilin ComGG [Sutcliffiella halmapala]